MVNLPLETKRLLLRDFVESDCRAVDVYASDPVVVRYLDWAPNTEEKTKEFVQRLLRRMRRRERCASSP